MMLCLFGAGQHRENRCGGILMADVDGGKAAPVKSAGMPAGLTLAAECARGDLYNRDTLSRSQADMA
jgi:hypothetical protein